jgi:hypothetical protein
MGCPHPAAEEALHDFPCVLAAERAEIQRRRGVHYEPGQDPAALPTKDLVGLALSGGGIRSATFSVGLLQGLERLRLLRVFDYLSTVSGGGFAGGWWSAWLARGGLRAQTPVALAQELIRRRPDLDGGALGAALRAWQARPTVESHQALEAALAATLDVLAADGNLLPPAPGHTFPADEQTDPQRARHYVDDRVPDGAMAAGTDPIHHLRLFSNYLTPRKGLLSSDTWRAVTVVGRNLMLTWMVLLPILLGAILLGQLYFVWQQFVPRVAVEFIQPAGETAAAVLGRRAAAAASLLLALVAIQAFLAMLWMHYNNDGTPVTQGAALGILVLLVWGGLVMITSLETPPRRCTAFWDCFNRDLWQRYTVWDVTLWVTTLVALGVVAGAFLVARAPGGHTRGPARQLLANTATGRHALLMSVFVLVTGVLLFSGFAHEAVGALAAHFSLGNLTSVVTTLTTVGTVAGALYTALRSAPSANKDAASAPPGGVGRLVFALTPSLVLLLLATAGAWATHWMLGRLMAPPGTEARLALLTFLVFAGLGLCLVFAAYEAERPDRPRDGGRRLTLTGLTAGIALVAVLITSWVARDFTRLDLRVRVNWLVAGACIAGAAGLLWLGWRTMATPGRRTRWGLGITGFVILALVVHHAVGLARGGQEIDWAIRTTAIAGVAGLCYAVWLATGSQGAPHVRGPAIALAAVAVGAALAHMTGLPWSGAAFITPFLVALLACLVILGYVCRRQPATGRRVAMLTFGCIAALICLFLAATHLQGRLELRGDDGTIERRSLDRVTLEYQARQFRQGQPAAIRSGLLYAATSAVILAAAWAMALGWMADPNALSLHTFYRARLVRSYLGASNWRRHLRHRGIADPTEGDDVPLRRLDTCTYGGPYHLINTTLNLVGGRDLTTAQRSAAAFVLSRGYCGSTRTSYRATSAYMDGELSLGSAIAASGAAVSPSMGARSPSAALSMLLAFLNVRLGFWAPTPHRVHWRQPQARLWPYYLLWEMFSQTNDLNSYCYLTDGGHFDNTGLYALVERGCRFIVVVDNGADPGPRFEDLGDAVRRCRIDFGVEIRLDHLDVLRRSADGAPTSHAAVGTITYRPPHTTLLGWGDEVCEGTIVWIKPAVLARDPADVRQYGLQQAAFPQQSTGDQWFDEAQFESYRRLGEACAEAVFAAPAAAALAAGRLTPATVEAFFETVKTGVAPATPPAAR